MKSTKIFLSIITIAAAPFCVQAVSSDLVSPPLNSSINPQKITNGLEINSLDTYFNLYASDTVTLPNIKIQVDGGKINVGALFCEINDQENLSSSKQSFEDQTATVVVGGKIAAAYYCDKDGANCLTTSYLKSFLDLDTCEGCKNTTCPSGFERADDRCVPICSGFQNFWNSTIGQCTCPPERPFFHNGFCQPPARTCGDIGMREGFYCIQAYGDKYHVHEYAGVLNPAFIHDLGKKKYIGTYCVGNLYAPRSISGNFEVAFPYFGSTNHMFSLDDGYRVDVRGSFGISPINQNTPTVMLMEAGNSISNYYNIEPNTIYPVHFAARKHRGQNGYTIDYSSLGFICYDNDDITTLQKATGQRANTWWDLW